MNRKKRKLIYIRIKNSWRKELLHSNMIDITTCYSHGLPYNPKYPMNKIIMDFKNREEILKYGVMKI